MTFRKQFIKVKIRLTEEHNSDRGAVAANNTRALTYLGFSSAVCSVSRRILGKVSAVTVCHDLTAKRKQPASPPSTPSAF